MSEAVTTERRWLEAFFSALHCADIEYAVLRNYEDLPRSLSGSDLDIVVCHHDLEVVIRLLAEVVATMDGALVGCGGTGKSSTIHFLIPPTGGGWWGARVDFFTGVNYRGQELISAAEVLRHTTRHEGISVVEEDASTIIAAAKEALYNGLIPQKYKQHAARMMGQGGQNPNGSILDHLDDSGLAAFARMTKDESGDVDVAARLTFRRAVRRYALSQGVCRYFFHMVRDRWSKARRYLRPTGLTVAILGTDGAGKSAVIDRLLPVFADATHGGVHVHHLRPGLLPPLANLFGRRGSSNGPVTDPHASSASGMMGSLIRAGYYVCDYVLGYWLRTRLLIARRPDIVVFDRYYHDLLIDPRRFRIALPKSVLAAFARLLPKPDMVFCLVADPDVIHGRKPELPIAEVRRQVNDLEVLGKSLSSAVVIRTDQAIDQTIEDALTAFRDRLLLRGPKGCG